MPKDVFAERKVLEICVPSAVFFFNYDSTRLLDVMKELKVVLGHFSENFLAKQGLFSCFHYGK